MNLHDYDLNLLAIFDMIYGERHLTKAGERLNMSQPAVSQALKRLRDTLNDPLFVRSGKELIPTSCADSIAPQARQIVQLARNTFEDKGDFKPQESTRTFRLAMSDYTEMVVLPKLFKHLSEVAPNIRLECKHLVADQYRNSLDGEGVDIILGSSLKFGATIFQQALFEDEEVLLLRKDSPVLKENLDMEHYTKLRHAQFQWFFDEVTIDAELRKHNLKRDIVLEVQHEMVLPLILQNNELVVNMPKRMAEVFRDFLSLEMRPVPFQTLPYQICQYWHEKNHGGDIEGDQDQTP